ncbi:MAG: peptidoglycan editing factor PgeF [Patescibacteria group bacterium]
MIHFQIFEKFPQLVYGVSTKKDGSMKLFGQKEKDKKNLKNRQKFLSLFNLKIKDVVWAKLNHQGRVKIVTFKNCGQWIKNVDGLITKEENVFLSLTIADCFPVFFFEPKKKIIALAHASWRAILKGLISRIIKTIKKRFLSQPKDILMGIGPGIRSCHFEVKEKVAKKFLKKFGQKVLIKRKDQSFIDLAKSIKLEAIKNKILPQNIEDIKECTYCLKNKYFSYRRQRTKEIKAMMAIIGLKNVPRGTF